MTVAEFREMVDGVWDLRTSLVGAPVSEQAKEAARLQRSVSELRECHWPKRLKDEDREKALRVMDIANASIAATMEAV